MAVSPRGNVKVLDFGTKFSHLTAHRPTIGYLPVCGTKGRYGWKATGSHLILTKLRDSCQPRPGQLVRGRLGKEEEVVPRGSAPDHEPSNGASRPGERLAFPTRVRQLQRATTRRREFVLLLRPQTA